MKFSQGRSTEMPNKGTRIATDVKNCVKLVQNMSIKKTGGMIKNRQAV